MRFYNNDIAIVNQQGIFPDADNCETFFDNLLNGHVAIRDLNRDDENIVETKYHYSKNKKEPNALYASHCSQIPPEWINQYAEKHKLEMSESTGIEIVLFELLNRFEQENPGLLTELNTECAIGVATGEPFSHCLKQVQMYDSIVRQLPESLTPDEEKRMGGFMKRMKNYAQRDEMIASDLYTPLVFSRLKKQFGIDGICSVIDAACASSLAAINVALSRLRSGQCDMVVSGGIDIGLSNIILIAFAKCQVLNETVMNPFDIRSAGMNQGEAAGLFFLMRLEDARARNLPVLGVIRNCEGSSDGINGAMTEPTERGQVLAYERAYKGVTPAPLNYLECHGTGTSVGDKTELASISRFFHPLPPIGSVKANIGHTIGAAGASSLAKALKIIETKKIPALPNFKKGHEGFENLCFTENQELNTKDNVRIGVSSFGFGGANFHMVVDEYKDEELLSHPHKSQNFKYLLNGYKYLDLNYVQELFSGYKGRIPPVSLPYYDDTILGGVLVVDQLFSEKNINLSQALREKVGVISTSNYYLEKFTECQNKVLLLEIMRRLDKDSKANRDFVARQAEDYLDITEDTVAGSLNNLICGKITKDFDLKGPNFNVSCEKASLGAALSYGETLLENNSGAYLIVHFDEEENHQRGELERTGVHAFLVSDLEFAWKANLPIEATINGKFARRKDYGTHHQAQL